MYDGPGETDTDTSVTSTTATTMATTALDADIMGPGVVVVIAFNRQPFAAITCCDPKCCICDYADIEMLHADGEKTVYALKRLMLKYVYFGKMSSLLRLFWCRIKEDLTEPMFSYTRHFVIEKDNLEYAILYLGGWVNKKGSKMGSKKGNKKGNRKDGWIRYKKELREAQRAMRCVERLGKTRFVQETESNREKSGPGGET